MIFLNAFVLLSRDANLPSKNCIRSKPSERKQVMAARAKERILIDHDEIRQWAEERGAIPTRVKGTGGQNDVGILRLHFPEFSQDDEKLEPISWDEFFEEFDRKRLALLVEDRMPDGRPSNFNKIISRSTIEDFIRSCGPSTGRQTRRSASVRSITSAASAGKRKNSGKKQSTSARSQKRSTSKSSRSSARHRAA